MSRNAEPVIELQGITQAYQGPGVAVEAVRCIDLKVQAGEVLGVIGRRSSLALRGSESLPRAGAR